MTVPTFLFLVSLVSLVSQAQPQRAPVSILDGVAAQAGDGLVTLSEFDRVRRKAREENPPPTREAEERQRIEVLRELWTLRLEEQAGQELGLDPAQIDRINRANMEVARDREGLAAYLDLLREEGRDALADESEGEKKILRYLWMQAAQGKSFAAKRATRDQNIRPGELRLLFAENQERLAPETVQLRWLIITSASGGGPENAKASCEDARERILAGEDMALLVEERGSEFRDSRGLTPVLPPEAFIDSELVAFAKKAEIGELSQVLPLTNPKTGQPDPELGYQCAMLHERNVPPEPDFESPEVQRILRRHFTRQREDLILERERDRLRRNAYSWVNPLLAPSQPDRSPQGP